MRFRFHPLARREFLDALEYYDRQEPGLGERFNSVIEENVDKIRRSPSQNPIIEDNVHRRVTQKFPYSIIYLITGGEIFGVAIMHQSRRPGYWKERLK